MLDTIVSIILFIVSFAVLICIHEAGHLSMAKLFKVYCKEYSIGFGPAIFSKKKEGHETRFSIRAVPFGGYVSMYGEGMEDDPEFKDIPKERSLEGIKKWKKAIVLSAGVILNAVLAFVLIFISNFAFPTIAYTRKAEVTENSYVSQLGVENDDKLQFIYPSSYEDENGGISAFAFYYTDSEKVIHSDSFFIVDDNVWVNGQPYVLTYMFTGNKHNPVFTEGISLYKGLTKEELDNKLPDDEYGLKEDFKTWSEENSPEYFPNFAENPLVFDEDDNFFVDLVFKDADGNNKLLQDVQINVHVTKKAKKTINFFDNIGLSLKKEKVKTSVGQKFKGTFQDYGRAAGAVFKGLGVLFTGGIKNMSGVVGIFNASATLYANYTFATYLYFWGLISVNLAIFNLLPFPGLDGWQLLVTAIEAVTRKKVPMKAKSIMSLIGLALLFILMGFIIVIDILRIVGV